MIKKYLRKIGVYRWWIGGVVFGLVILPVVVFLLMPVIMYCVSSVKQYREVQGLVASAPQLKKQHLEIEKAIDAINSMTNRTLASEVLDQSSLMKRIYGLADSAGCKVEKVEVSDHTVTGQTSVLPVHISGNGEYSSIGNFTEGLENLPFSIRIKNLSIKQDKGKLLFSTDVAIGQL